MILQRKLHWWYYKENCIDDTTKKIATLDNSIKDVASTVTNLPDLFDSKLEIIQETLRSEFDTQFNSFENVLPQIWPLSVMIPIFVSSPMQQQSLEL